MSSIPDENECAIYGKEICPTNSYCSNSEGGFECTCSKGFYKHNEECYSIADKEKLITFVALGLFASFFAFIVVIGILFYFVVSMGKTISDEEIIEGVNGINIELT